MLNQLRKEAARLGIDDVRDVVASAKKKPNNNNNNNNNNADAERDVDEEEIDRLLAQVRDLGAIGI